MRLLRPISLLLLAALATSLHARTPNFKKYPLRINVLSSRSNSHIPLITLPSVNMPDVGNGGSNLSADDGAGFSPPATINLPLYEHPDPVFYGAGRADLFAAGLPRGVNFTYDNCLGSVGVTMPHQPLYARWKKTGRILEILVPVAATRPNRPQQWDKCQLDVALQDFVYLLLHNGAVVRVTQDGFARKPALREFTEGIASIATPQLPTASPRLPNAPIQPAVLIHTQ